MKRLAVIVFFVMGLRPYAICQDMSHSPYSVYGIGILNDRTSSLNRAMGGTGIAVQDAMNLNHANPASYASIEFPVNHIFEVGTFVESNHYRANHLFESKAKGGLTNLSYWFRFKPWYASTFGLSPFSSVSYNIAAAREMAIGEQATYIFKGSGNITQLFWGNGFKVGKNVYAGATVGYLFGTITRDESVQSDDARDMLTLQNKTFSNQLKFDFGLQYRMKLLGMALIIGATYNSGFDMNGKGNFLLTNMSGDTLTDYKGEKIKYKLPAEFGAGLSLQSERSILSSDIRFGRWSTASLPDENVSLRDSWKISAGYTHAHNEYAENYTGMIGFRLGVHFQQHYLIVRETPLNNWGGSMGISLPVSDGRSVVNLTYAWDRMGTLQNNLIVHTAQKVQLDIVIRDLWGQRRKFD